MAAFYPRAAAGSYTTARDTIELLQANLGSSGLITARVCSPSSQQYVITRALKQDATIATADGKAVASVDIDRGTFLPIDIYNSAEIEEIADETLGQKRRGLLDDLRANDLHDVQIKLADKRRELEANADAIRSKRKSLTDLSERAEELADSEARLAAMPETEASESANAYLKATKQQSYNSREIERLKRLADRLRDKRAALAELGDAVVATSFTDLVDSADSVNEPLVSGYEEQLKSLLAAAHADIKSALRAFDDVGAKLTNAKKELQARHTDQALHFASLAEQAKVASALLNERAHLEQQVADFRELQQKRVLAQNDLARLQGIRQKLKAEYISARDSISQIRQDVADGLQKETGEKVRLRVVHNADDLTYQQQLLQGIKGAGVRNHEDVLKSLLMVRPEDLAQLIDRNDVEDFNNELHFGDERASKILARLRENIDPLELELTSIDDRIMIELNVASGAEPNFKDASDLSRGQKCTALLPLLLARRDNPIIVDQPEDNLDNHFIYETIVDAIQRLKATRQMVLITHNANIPVLAEADLVIVMNSDGKVGFIEKLGSIDACRDEIIDLLEGGEKAFALRSARYYARS